MANIFKLKTNAAMPASAGTPLTLYTGPGAANTHRAIVLGLILCNKHTSQVTVSVTLESNTSDTETNENNTCSIPHLDALGRAIWPLLG